MQSRQWLIHCACGLLLLTLAGCHSLFYPYGTPGYPGAYGQPPGQPFAPQGPALGAPTQVVPNGNFGPPSTGSWKQPTQTWDPRSDAPTYDPNSSVDNTTEKLNTIPDPKQLEAPNFPAPIRVGPDDEKSFEEDETPFGFEDDSRFEFDESGESTIRPDGGFQTPFRVTPVSSTRQLEPPAGNIETAELNPYDYDRKRYRFLRGVAEYDPRDKTWHLMYNDRPDSSDKYGGDISLMNHPGLAGLRNNEVVYVEGHVDTRTRDSKGKPRYHIDHMQRLVPKKQ